MAILNAAQYRLPSSNDVRSCFASIETAAVGRSKEVIEPNRRALATNVQEEDEESNGVRANLEPRPTGRSDQKLMNLQ